MVQLARRGSRRSSLAWLTGSLLPGGPPPAATTGPDPDDPDESCPVCLEPLLTSARLQQPRDFACSHAVCESCSVQLARRALPCPLCRASRLDGGKCAQRTLPYSSNVGKLLFLAVTPDVPLADRRAMLSALAESSAAPTDDVLRRLNARIAAAVSRIPNRSPSVAVLPSDACCWRVLGLLAGVDFFSPSGAAANQASLSEEQQVSLAAATFTAMEGGATEVWLEALARASASVSAAAA